MLLRTCSLLVVTLLLLWCRISDAFALRERRTANKYDFDLYDESEDENSEEITNKMYSLCGRIHKRQQVDTIDKRVSTPLLMRMCDLLS